jgi:cardiolipin synthase
MRLTGLPPRAGNHVELLLYNDLAFRSKGEAIHEARRSVWAEYYIVEDDETGRTFLAGLTERARAGCDIRLLYDAVGSSDVPEESLEALRAAGGKTEAFLPMNPLRKRWSAHLRNHRELLVVDERIGFTGGMNVGDEYARGTWTSAGAGRGRRNRPWRDAHLRVEGPAVFDLATVFAEDWTFAAGDRLVPSSIPLPTMDGSWALVGSAKLDFRSFSLNFELGALVFDRAFAALLEERFTGDLARSREVTLATVERRGFSERARLGLARLLAPLL